MGALCMQQDLSNLITGRQLRAARVLAGLTQRTLGVALGVANRFTGTWSSGICGMERATYHFGHRASV